MPTSLRSYPATMVRIVDGDTVFLELDLGFRLRLQIDVRLAGINAPEHGTPEGDKAKAQLALILAQGVLTANIHGLDKYGRQLADVLIKPAKGDVISAGAELLRLGLAKPWDGEGKKPV